MSGETPYRTSDAPRLSPSGALAPGGNLLGDRAMAAMFLALVLSMCALGGGFLVALHSIVGQYWESRRRTAAGELATALESGAVRALIAANDPDIDPPLELGRDATPLRGSLWLHGIERVGPRIPPDARGAIVSVDGTPSIHIAHARLPDTRLAHGSDDLRWLAFVRRGTGPPTAGPRRHRVRVVDVATGQLVARAEIIAEDELAMAAVCELVEAAIE